MPCTLLHARTHQEVEQYIQDVDVVILNRCKFTGFLERDSSIYSIVPLAGERRTVNAPVPVARFFSDPWYMPRYKARFERSRGFANFFREYNIRILPYRELFEQHCPEWIDSMFWSPRCAYIQDCNVEKDIDVLFWGNTVRQYVIRNTMKALLEKCIVSEEEEVDESLVMYRISLNGRTYKLAMLRFRARGRFPCSTLPLYRGEKLYKLLSRAKICPAGPRLYPRGAPIGKFFENAACGAVSLTIDFTDRKELGFEHGKHLWITELHRGGKIPHFLEDLAYLLEHPDLIEEMSKNAKELIRIRHTPVIRGRELYEFLCVKVGTS